MLFGSGFCSSFFCSVFRGICRGALQLEVPDVFAGKMGSFFFVSFSLLRFLDLGFFVCG